MRKQDLHTDTLTALQASPDSARKGLQQYHTPQIWAEALASLLTQERKVIADLHCGNGSLLEGAMNSTTQTVLGSDLDAKAKLPNKNALTGEKLQRHLITGDITDIYPLLAEVNTKFDLLTLNPPFSLRWDAEKLKYLRKDKEDKIESTLATLRMIPKLLTEKGEAMMIGNGDTLKRISEKYPEEFKHVWFHLDLPSFYPNTGKDLRIGVLYIARWCKKYAGIKKTNKNTPELIAKALKKTAHLIREGKSIKKPSECSPQTLPLFLATKKEYQRQSNKDWEQREGHNVTIDKQGKLSVRFSAFQRYSTKIDHNYAKLIAELNGRHPLDLAIQRSYRIVMQQLQEKGICTVHPKATEAIENALESWHVGRAPLIPLSPAQRLGWLDENDDILCIKSFKNFSAGQRYPFTTENVTYKKREVRGFIKDGKQEDEEVLVEGQDLCISIFEFDSAESPSVDFLHHVIKCVNTGELPSSLTDLLDHFEIPDVPDIATLNPTQYQRNVELLKTLNK